MEDCFLRFEIEQMLPNPAEHQQIIFLILINPLNHLSANPTKWSQPLKQFICKFCMVAIKGLRKMLI